MFFLTRTLALVALLLVTAGVAPLLAAGPVVERLFPAGGSSGTRVEVTASGKFEQWPVKAVLVATTSNLAASATSPAMAGLTVTAAEEKGKLIVEIAADAAPGVRWLRLHDGLGAADPVRFWVGTLPEIIEQEPNNAADKAQVLPATDGAPGAGVLINGRLEKRGDADTFRVTLAAGQTLVAACDAQQGLGSPVDAVLQVLSPGGIVLAQNDDARGIDPLLPFTAPTAGDYLVRVFGFPAMADSSIQFSGSEAYIYRLTVTTSALVDGLFPLTTTAGAASSHEAFGWNLSPDSAARTFAVPLVANAPRLPTLLEATPLAVETCPSLVELETNDDTAQGIAIPTAITGRILQPQDRDVYSFTVTAGQRLTFAVESLSLGYEADTVIEITDAAGKSLIRLDDTNGGVFDPRLTQGFDQAGEYRVAVSDLFGHGSPRHAYLLRILPATPDFSIGHVKHGIEVAVGKTVELPISITREHGFAEEIVITAEGLPAGASLAPATSAASGDSSKELKLVLTAPAAAFSGPIRLLGTAGPLQHHASSTLTGSRSIASELWLTVTP